MDFFVKIIIIKLQWNGKIPNAGWFNKKSDLDYLLGKINHFKTYVSKAGLIKNTKISLYHLKKGPITRIWKIPTVIELD